MCVWVCVFFLLYILLYFLKKNNILYKLYKKKKKIGKIGKTLTKIFKKVFIYYINNFYGNEIEIHY